MHKVSRRVCTRVRYYSHLVTTHPAPSLPSHAPSCHTILSPLDAHSPSRGPLPLLAVSLTETRRVYRETTSSIQMACRTKLRRRPCPHDASFVRALVASPHAPTRSSHTPRLPPHNVPSASEFDMSPLPHAPGGGHVPARHLDASCSTSLSAGAPTPTSWI